MMDGSEKGKNGKPAADSFDDDSLSSCLHEICDIYEEPVLFPRVGEQYQVEIPPVETKSVLFQLTQIPFDDVKMPAVDGFGIGLAIPIKWVQYAVDNIKIKCEKEEFSNAGNLLGMERSAHLHNSSNTQLDYKFNGRGSALENPRFACKVEFLNSSHQEIHVACSSDHVMGNNDQNDHCLSLLESKTSGNFRPLPGLPTLSWSDSEKKSFLLGLYIFGKNLVQVKRFMENKRMGDILSFYYGKFYRSEGYHRWSECRKIRRRRSIHGQRIFTGWRQQELLSRIFSSACKELQDTLLEAAKTFNEGRSTLEKFVFKLKAAVGLQVLVDAIGIGKGTHDLTGVALDHVRTNPTVPVHPEVPVGRACSSLTSANIIKFLTGDFRQSKARSNDLFWEAVWPRLLARGWHSEQPRNHGSLAVKNSLVFLVPGVKKFSRKRLVKGTHFFDSISDVLSKVASQPKLLELDVEGAKSGSSGKEENGWVVDAKVCRNGSFNHHHHFYLHPKRSGCNSERMKFTVVDTSLVQKEGSFKMMEVKGLPLGVTSNCDPSADSLESRSESSSETEDSTDLSDDEDESKLSSFAEKKKPEDNRSNQSAPPNILIPFPNSATTNGYAPGDKDLARLNDNKTVNGSAPTIKRRKLTACGGETDRRACSIVKRIQREKLTSDDTLFPDASSFKKKTDRYHSSNCKAENGIVDQTNLPDDNLQSRTSFDLNNLPPDADVAESSSDELKDEDMSHSSEGKQQIGLQDSNDALVDEQLSTGIRRQSTRNRPPTAKALEALASGFLGTKRSWRPSNSTRRRSRKARKTYEDPASATAANLGNVASNKDYNESARKETHELLGVP